MAINLKSLSFFLFFILFVFVKSNDKTNSTEESSTNEKVEAPEDQEPEQDEFESSHVIKLTDSNFESALTNTTNWLVEFYAPWCGHCRTLMPKFNQAAEQNKFSDVKFGKVDATVEEKLSTQFKIEGYPTILWITKRDGIVTSKPFKNDREVMLLTAFVKEEMTTTLHVDTVAELLEAKPRESNAILIVIDKTDSSYDKNFMIIQKTSLRAGKDKIITTNSQEIRKHLGVHDVGVNFVVGWTNTDKGLVFFKWGKEEINPESYVRDLLKERVGIMELANESKMSEILDGALKSAILVYGNYTDPYVEESVKNARSVLSNYLGVYYTVHSHTDNTTNNINNIIEALRVELKDFPALIILNPPPKISKKDDFVKFKLIGSGKALSVAEISKFLDDVTNNRLLPLLASDPIPDAENRYVNGVENLVGLSIEGFVNTPGKDALIAVCTGLSYKCRRLDLIFERLATRFDNSTIIFGRIDFNNNEFEHIDYDFVPTIVLFKDNAQNKPKYNRENIVYLNADEVITSNLLTTFIKNNAFHPPQFKDVLSKASNKTEEKEILDRELELDSEEVKHNITRIEVEDESEYKTEDEIETLRQEENRKKEEEEQRIQDEKEKRERDGKEVEEEEPDLQEPEVPEVQENTQTQTQTDGTNNSKKDEM